MKKMKISIFLLIVFLLLAFSVFAARINSTNYKQNIIVSFGSENVSSSSYKTNIALGIINNIINSTSFINKLGFFHILLLADGQPCTTASQCEGGFCCSNLCKSSACPSGGGVAAAAGGGGGGGVAAAAGGGGGSLINITKIEVPKVKDFSLSSISIKEHLVLGGAKINTVTIKNTGNTKLNFDLSILTVADFAFLSDNSFSLEAGQEKTVEINIIGKILGSYIGEIEVSGDGIKKSIGIVIEVESEQVLFDAKIDIPSGYKEVEAGGDLKAQITLLNVGPPRKVDVTTTYLIKDWQGNVVYENSETFAVEKQTSFVKSFKIPKNLKPGDYLAIIELRYEKSFAVSSELFKVIPKEEIAVLKASKSNALLMSVLVIFFGLIFLFAYLLIPKVKGA